MNDRDHLVGQLTNDDPNVKYVVGDGDDDLRSTGATPPLHQSTWQKQLTIWRGPISTSTFIRIR